MESNIDSLINIDKFDFEFLHYQLGLGVHAEYSSKDIDSSIPYTIIGQTLFKAIQSDMYDNLCNKKYRDPKDWVYKLISENVDKLFIDITSMICDKYNISKSISIPAVTLLFKYGIINYCSSTPRNSRANVEDTLIKIKNKYFY